MTPLFTPAQLQEMLKRMAESVTLPAEQFRDLVMMALESLK